MTKIKALETPIFMIHAIIALNGTTWPASVLYKASVYLTCQWDFYFHVKGNIGTVQKIEFEIRPDLGCGATFKTSRKVVLDNPSVCLFWSVRQVRDKIGA